MFENITTWKILAFVAIISLILSLRKRSAIWGGVTLGTIIGIIAAFFKDGSYDWYYVAKYAIIGTLIGAFAEIISLISMTIKKEK